MTGRWMLPAALAALLAGWMLLARPLAHAWDGGWWGRAHGRRAAARALQRPEPAAGLFAGGTGWALLTRLAAGAGLFWLVWPASAAAECGGWAALGWVLGGWMLLGAVRDYAVLHAAAHPPRPAPEGLAELWGGRVLWRLFLLLGWWFCVLLLAALGGGMARLLGVEITGGIGGTGGALSAALALPGAPDLSGSAVTAAVLLSTEALTLGVLVRHRRMRQPLRAALALGMLAAAVTVALVCPIPLSARLLCVLLLGAAYCAAAAPAPVLAAPRAVLSGWLLLVCLALLGLAVLLPGGSAALPAAAQAGGGALSLLFLRGGGAAIGLPLLAAGSTAPALLRPEVSEEPLPRRARALCAVGFGGALLLGLLAAAVAALLGGSGALPAARPAPAAPAATAAALAAADCLALLAGTLTARFGVFGPAAAAVAVLAAVLAGLSALDAAALAGRQALEGIFGSPTLPADKLAPWRKLLRSRPMASGLTLLPALLLSGRPTAEFWPLLDCLGFLLAALALLAAALAHRRAGQLAWPLLPLAALLGCAGLANAASAAAQGAASGQPGHAAAPIFVILTALLAAAQGVRRYLQCGQTAPHPAKPRAGEHPG